MGVELSPAGRDEEEIVDNLMQLYLYEFSDVSQRDIWPNGRYGYRTLALYWATEGFGHPFLIRVDGELAGFALVLSAIDLPSMDPGPTVAEFFVMRKYRRRGVGRAAATALFRKFPGPWWVAERGDNMVAQAFWRAVIATYTGGAYQERVQDLDGERTVIQTFESRVLPPEADGP